LRLSCGRSAAELCRQLVRYFYARGNTAWDAGFEADARIAGYKVELPHLAQSSAKNRSNLLIARTLILLTGMSSWPRYSNMAVSIAASML
jgi:hypothetical protein